MTSTELDTSLTTVVGDDVPGVIVDGDKLPAAAVVAFGTAGDGTDGHPVSAADKLPVKGTFTIDATDFNAFVDAIAAVRTAVETIPGANVSEPAEPWHIVGDPGEPALLNGWTAPLWPPRFYRDADRVWVEFFVTGGGIGDPVFTLPDGYRPDTAVFDAVGASVSGDFSTRGSAAIGGVSDGTVVVFAADEDLIFGSLSFRPA